MDKSTNVFNHSAAMDILQNAASQLRELGLSCSLIPMDLATFGAPAALLVGHNDLATAAAFVASANGSMTPHLANDRARKQFAQEVDFYIEETACYAASPIDDSKN